MPVKGRDLAMTTYIKLKTPDASYNRSKDVTLTPGTCDVCGSETEVLNTDTSDGEYGPVQLCKKCIDKMPWGRN